MIEQLEVVAKVRGRDKGSLARARLVNEPVAQNQLHMKNKEGRSQARSNLCVHFMDDTSFEPLVLSEHAAPGGECSMVIPTEGTQKS
jgi:hypothetical protein